MKFKQILLASCLIAGTASAQIAYNALGAGNPLIPGYFADPTVKKFGDTYYMYATTDGSGAGFGPAQVWSSKDFVNWTILPMNWPDSHWIWAPDVLKHELDGKYYYFYCQPCKIYGGVSDTPRGPWKNILGESEAVLIEDRFVTNAITLDGQTFVDDDGSVYMYWGTWGIYKGFGCGAGKMTPDLKGFSETRLIENTEVTDFFEAPFVIKRNGIYYFMYSSGSCHDHTYRLQYATATQPLGPYTYKGCILETNADGTIHGPGHHSVLQEGDDYYVVYHRHDNPHSTRGFHRQLAADKMEFDAAGNIKVITPTHEGIGALAPSIVKSKNLAENCKVRASSYYNQDFRPEYAVDENNGTLWRPLTPGDEWIELDLGKSQTIQTIWTQFEYGTAYYQYLIETSNDGKRWELFADKRENHLSGSPLVDFGKTKARYVRLTTTGNERNGFRGAIWNIKVYGEVEAAHPQQWMGLTAADWDGRVWKNNQGMLSGQFTLQQGSARVERLDGKNALVLAPNTILMYDHPILATQKEYTLSATVHTSKGWEASELQGSLAGSKITLRSGTEPLAITNLRYYNWKLEEVEKEYNQTNNIVRNPAAQKEREGLVVSITADEYAVNDTIGYITNHGLKGHFRTQSKPTVVEMQQGKAAFKFDGEQHFQSNFALPRSMMNNAPYTLEAWVLNPMMELNECVADFTSSHQELEKIMLVNGTEPRCGLMNHYGWYEDVGSKEAKELENKWQHIYVCFDGHIEWVYINGQLISEKDIKLLVKPSQYITLGRNAENNWPFTGFIHSLKLWDEYLPYQPT